MTTNKLLLLLLALISIVSCGGGGSSSNITDDSGSTPITIDPITIDDEDNLPSLTAFDPHWGRIGVFNAAADCGACHSATDLGVTPAVMRSASAGSTTPDPQGSDLSPYSNWQASVMAQSFTDPYFRATMKHEVETFPALAGFIEDTCLTCHSPMARTHAHQTGINLQTDNCLLEDGCYRAETAMQDNHAREGVSCTLCHQVTDAVFDQTPGSGNYEIAQNATPTIYGPFQNPVSQPMLQQLNYEPAFGLQTQASEMCASCHNLYTPTIDIETHLPTGGKFPEQTPYTEWLHSDYANTGSNTKQCQDCHMGLAENNYETQIATRNGTANTNWPLRSPFYSHDMLGANTWLLNVLESYRNELGLANSVSPGAFTAKEQQTRAFLQTAATLQLQNVSRNSNQLAFSVEVTNNGGHKFPTGFPARRAWLATRVTDNNGAVIFENGVADENGWLPQDHEFTSESCMSEHKAEGFDSDDCYAEHVSHVEEEDDLPIYEAVLGSSNDTITHVLLFADHYLKDNRIPPRGFHNSTADEDIAPVELDGDGDFNQNASGTDTVQYDLRLPDNYQAPLNIEVNLYYQSVRPTFVQALHGDHEWIDHFRSIAALTPPQPEVVTSASITF